MIYQDYCGDVKGESNFGNAPYLLNSVLTQYQSVTFNMRLIGRIQLCDVIMLCHNKYHGSRVEGVV